MPTLNDYEEKFQERVEEMYILAKRLDERAEDLKSASKQSYADNEKKVETLVVPLIDKITEASEVLVKLDGAATTVNGYVNTFATHLDRRNLISIILMGLCGFIIMGTIFWVKHAHNLVHEANLQVAQANATLGHKPLFLPAAAGLSGNGDDDYVRVIPDSEATMKHKNGKDYPGVYAKIWHQGSKK